MTATGCAVTAEPLLRLPALRLPALRQPGEQLALWDWVGNIQFVHLAQTRHATGQFAEELALKLMGGRAMVTDGQADICPDIKLSDKAYLEVKSVRACGQGIVYEHILDRAQRFVRRNRVSLRYVFVIYDTKASESPDLFELRAKMAANVKAVIIVPFKQIVDLTSSLRMEIMNYRSSSRAGKPNEPMPGWRIPNAQLRTWMTGQPELSFGVQVFGFHTIPFPVYRHDN